MTEALEQLCARVDHLEERYRNDKYAEYVLFPLQLLIEVRDELRQPGLFEHKELPVVAVKGE